MAEYIEREKVYDIFAAKQHELLKFHRFYQLNDEQKEEFNRYDSYLDEIKAIPTADVVGVAVFEQVKWERDTALETLEEHGIGLGQIVKHGEWIEKHWYKRGDCYHTKNCSLCNCAVKPKHTYNYCPNCGAEMDKS